MMNGTVEQSVDLQISKLKNLPALPEIGIRILEVINNPDVEIEHLVKVISLSPGLVARLLGMANSAFFGQTQPVEELHTAIVRVLGLQLVRSLTLGVLLNVQLDTKNCQNFDSHWFWLHSLITAIAAQKLANEYKWGDVPPATAYTGGLLLHIGFLVAAFTFPEELNAILAGSPKSLFDAADDLAQQFGTSHYQMGYLILKKWRLPAVYQTMLRDYENCDPTTATPELNICLWASRQICYWVLDDGSSVDSMLEVAEKAYIPLETVSNVFNALMEQKENVYKLAMELGR